MLKLSKFYVFLIIAILSFSQCGKQKVSKIDSTDLEWPEINQVTKPWSRWWWMGNIVTKDGISQNMKAYQEAGLGGLEITPIYGVKGYEDQFIDFLSPKWMEMLEYTLDESEELDMGIDIANTSSWPFGGPWVGPEYGAKRMVIKKYQVEGGQKVNKSVSYKQKPLLLTIGKESEISEIKQPIKANHNLQQLAIRQIRFEKPLPLITLMAFSEDKEKSIDISDKVNENGQLVWNAPTGKWTLYAAYAGLVGKMVERAGPGGEGRVIDHLSEKAIKHHVKVFDKAFAGYDTEAIRAYFNDSYEVDEDYGSSNWTAGFFNEFQKRRGYDLKKYLPILVGDVKDKTKRERILCDYRETISDLLLDEFTKPWDKWAASDNKMTRNQAHGAPANLLDLYAASDVPETEGTDRIRFKFASSAVHVTEKPLASAEACTWLGEHFKGSLADVKEVIDLYFLGGVNHIVYHGTTYSPEEERWPGWLFYAAVHFGPTNTFWDDFDVLNNYITRAQSFLQTGKPDNDILLYFPIHDEWSESTRHLLKHFDGNAEGSSARETGEELLEHGFTFDFVSDRQIADLKSKDNQIYSGKAEYKTVLIPDANHIPLKTYKQLHSLAKKGAKIVFLNDLPDDVPGMNRLKQRQNKIQEINNELDFTPLQSGEIRTANPGKGSILVGNNVGKLLSQAGLKAEKMVEDGLDFIRRKHENGKYYFIKNNSGKAINKWVPLSDDASFAMLYNPMTEEKGKAYIKDQSVYIQLAAGETYILKTFNKKVELDPGMYPYWKKAGDPIEIKGNWNLEFVKGGPELPASITTNELKSWTKLGGKEFDNFSGTAMYSTSFSVPESKNATAWKLALGEVHESARIFINGKEVGATIRSPHTIEIDDKLIQNDDNSLKIIVSNLMANRIAYMDRHDIKWKKFYNINVGASTRANVGEDGVFSAKNWKPLPSGLIGPVKLFPLELLNL